MRVTMISSLRVGLTVLAWSLVGWTVVYWAMALMQPAPQIPAAAPAQAVDIRAPALAAWLTPPAAGLKAEPVSASRFSLVGVIADGRGGVAVLTVDGQPAQPFMVGSAVTEGVMLRSVGPRFAELAADRGGPTLQRLELPPPPTGPTVASPAEAGSRGSAQSR